MARALIIKPPVLMLDEPTAALDTLAEKEICKNIFEHLSDKTIITITHRKEILNYCNRVFEMKNKKIFEV